MTAAPPVPGAFDGPLFIVGMPRSGTKLLRDLLNQHSAVGIPRIETEFLPYWFEHWQDWGDLSEQNQFQRFYERVRTSSYFRYQNDADSLISGDVWFSKCADFTAEGVFEALMRHDGLAPEAGMIWGDKSPSYVRHLNALSERFPTARFVHIVRDVRDYCLSIHKAWGKNMLRAAQRWTDDVQSAIEAGKGLEGRVLVIRYEDLLDNPEATLRKIAGHIERDFEPQMTRLSQTAENLGDTAGAVEVIANNQSKYLEALKPDRIQAIEAIAGTVLRSLDYPVSYTGETTRVPPYRQTMYRMSDAFNLVWSDIKRGEFWDRLGLRWKQHRESR